MSNNHKRNLAIPLIGIYLETDEIASKRERSMWIRDWLTLKHLCRYDNLLRELSLEDKNNYRRWLRMNEDSFKKLLAITESTIKKQGTVMREAVSAEKRLAITLRFLATGKDLLQKPNYAFINCISFIACFAN